MQLSNIKIYFENSFAKTKLSSIQKQSITKSLNLLMKSEIYNSIISTILNYQSTFDLTPKQPHVIMMDGEPSDINEFFIEMRRMLIVYGYVLLVKRGENKFEYYPPSIIDTNNFSLGGSWIKNNDGEKVKGFTTIDGEKIPIENCVIIANTPLQGIDVVLPEYWYVLDEIENVEIMKRSINIKRTITNNIAFLLKLKNPSEGIGFGRTEDEVAELQQQTQTIGATLSVRQGSGIMVPPDTELEIPQPLQANNDEEYLFKRISEIASAVNIPSFLITGDLKELNYAASRSALQDFVVYSNRQISRLIKMLRKKINLGGRLTLPPPTTISTAEAIKYFEFLKTLCDDPSYGFDKSELKTKMILGGLL